MSDEEEERAFFSTMKSLTLMYRKLNKPFIGSKCVALCSGIVVEVALLRSVLPTRSVHNAGRHKVGTPFVRTAEEFPGVRRLLRSHRTLLPQSGL